MAITAADLMQATRLTSQGRLLEATRAIQRALAGHPEPEAPKPPAAGVADVTDVTYREVQRPPSDKVSAPSLPAGRSQAARPSSFLPHSFDFGGERHPYHLYVPSRSEADGKLPLVVMLHGCKQDAADFARGTAMNALGEQEKVLVLYPEQLRKANGMGCWNWFEPGHQGRGAGEPAMLAALVQQVAAEHDADPARIYVAGLSAGGAMAAVLGQTYPDVFAAVGIHSGLPAGAAHDMPSAFSAMRKGTGSRSTKAAAVPTIVFHGTADKTVSSKNADAIVDGQLAAWTARGTQLASSKQAQGAGARTAACTRWQDGDKKSLLESWSVAASPHAWSGGDASGSFTDPAGPDASAQMLRFFLQHRQRG
ncbi:PHB depolymerase family esterase [uncultured Ramlibacter sp.]|uniref:extracellular catalytic domain type 1 short-chain-length polyhydroxyalkanoate depolymerase n=1 Tax=uncultured Ramlibacter sp. TaxID=260755 RepID=UPI002613D244|nr:PHB depolymerase family esterase [uncultured Ramlibacter sp.]